MPERPLLIFPLPEKASKSKLPSRYSRDLRRPSPQRQGERLMPMFVELRSAFKARSVEIRNSVEGADPNQVLVIETIGSVENFANAVKRIEGLEWLGEIDIDEIEPDDDFFNEKNPNKKLRGRLYFISSNQAALGQMISLWERYNSDHDVVFERGYAKYRDIFNCMKTIRRWGVEDRFFETNAIEIWQKELQEDSNKQIIFEVELWFYNNPEKRQESENQVSRIISQLNGNIISQCIIEEISYHCLLVKLPADGIRAIIDHQETKLVKCDQIMFFRPEGQAVVVNQPFEEYAKQEEIGKLPLPSGEPIIALLDGLPLENHHLLSGRIIVDDPDDHISHYTADERVHGTCMASLIIYGDLSDNLEALSRPIYVRPIMIPDEDDEFYSPRNERVPSNILFTDLIHRSIRRLFEREEDSTAAQDIKIINISVCDPYRQFVRQMSPLAKLLDWLSFKYGVLFIISAGNHPSGISLGISSDQFKLLENDVREEAIVKALYSDRRNRRLLSPAESINALTIGSAHIDSSKYNNMGDIIDPFEEVLPSPISAFGSGYRRALKPDIIFSGGRQQYRRSLTNRDPLTIEPINSPRPPGNKTAVAGQLNHIAYSRGTSNSAAQMSHMAGVCYETLQGIFKDNSLETEMDNFEIPLLKAMLTHGCFWGNTGNRINDILHTTDNSKIIKEIIGQWLGYGIPDIDRVLNCIAQRATLLGYGALSDGEADVFHLPLPPSLDSISEWRRLTVTLAWFSPINTNNQKYRTASLWFDVEDFSLIGTARSDADWQAVKRGTLQHEVFEGRKAEPFPEGNEILLKVNCRQDAGKIVNPIPYGIVTSLEVSEEININIYDEIKTRISVPVQIQQSTTSA